MQFLRNNEQICDAIVTVAMLLIYKETLPLNILSTLPASILTFSSVQTIHIHHNGKGHFVFSSFSTNKVKIYNSLNTKPTTELFEQITTLYSFDSIIPKILQVTLPACQSVSVDCGLFAVAYVTDLAIGKNPVELIYDQ